MTLVRCTATPAGSGLQRFRMRIDPSPSEFLKSMGTAMRRRPSGFRRSAARSEIPAVVLTADDHHRGAAGRAITIYSSIRLSVVESAAVAGPRGERVLRVVP